MFGDQLRRGLSLTGGLSPAASSKHQRWLRSGRCGRDLTGGKCASWGSEDAESRGARGGGRRPSSEEGARPGGRSGVERA